jgi:hypothetical protein
MYLTNLMPLSMPPSRPSLRSVRPQVAVVEDFDPPVVRSEARAREQLDRDGTTIPSRRADVVNPEALAARIVKAGRVCRGEISGSGVEPTLPMARAIIAAGIRARSAPTAPELPELPLARAICLAAQKVNGTIDAAGERFLSDYLGKFVATRELLR